MKKLGFLVLAVCLLVATTFALAGCGGGGDDDELIGIWTDPTGAVEFEFKSDGVLVLRMMGAEEQSTYTAKGGKLASPDPETGELSEVEYKIDGDNLILGADGEEGTLIRKK